MGVSLSRSTIPRGGGGRPSDRHAAGRLFSYFSLPLYRLVPFFLFYTLPNCLVSLVTMKHLETSTELPSSQTTVVFAQYLLDVLTSNYKYFIFK